MRCEHIETIQYKINSGIVQAGEIAGVSPDVAFRKLNFAMYVS